MDKKKLGLVLLVVAAMIFGSFSIFAVQDNWTYLGAEGYTLVATGEEPVVYSVVQEADKEKINKAIDKDANIVEKWGKNRPDVITPIKTKKLSSKNALADVAPRAFEVSYENNGETHKVKIDKLNVNKKTVLTVADPEFSGFPHKLVASPDSKKYLIHTLNGLWMVDAEKENGKKISKDSYNGKSRVKLQEELAARANENEDGLVPTLFWNENPIFSPNSSKVVYMSNKDCTDVNGISMWVYDLASEEEAVLVKNTGNEFYIPVGWVNESQLLVKKISDNYSYQLVDLNGNVKELAFEGQYPEVMTIENGVIVYTSDYNVANEVYIARVENDKLVNIYNSSVNGFLILNSASVCPDASKASFIYGTDDKGFRKLSVIDLANKTELNINQNRLKGKIAGAYVKWMDNDRILVHTDEYQNGLQQLFSWVYSIKGGK